MSQTARRGSVLVGAGIVLSRIAGLLRELVAGRVLGNGIASDALVASLRIPNLLQNLLGEGVPGMSTADTRTYLEFVADQRLAQLGLPKQFGASNPFAFMELQDVQELSNFFERTVSAYQVGVEGEVAFDEDF